MDHQALSAPCSLGSSFLFPEAIALSAILYSLRHRPQDLDDDSDAKNEVHFVVATVCAANATALRRAFFTRATAKDVCYLDSTYRVCSVLLFR